MKLYMGDDAIQYVLPCFITLACINIRRGWWEVLGDCVYQLLGRVRQPAHESGDVKDARAPGKATDTVLLWSFRARVALSSRVGSL